VLILFVAYFNLMPARGQVGSISFSILELAAHTAAILDILDLRINTLTFQ